MTECMKRGLNRNLHADVEGDGGLGPRGLHAQHPGRRPPGAPDESDAQQVRLHSRVDDERVLPQTELRPRADRRLARLERIRARLPEGLAARPQLLARDSEPAEQPAHPARLRSLVEGAARRPADRVRRAGRHGQDTRGPQAGEHRRRLPGARGRPVGECGHVRGGAAVQVPDAAGHSGTAMHYALCTSKLYCVCVCALCTCICAYMAVCVWCSARAPQRTRPTRRTGGAERRRWPTRRSSTRKSRCASRTARAAPRFSRARAPSERGSAASVASARATARTGPRANWTRPPSSLCSSLRRSTHRRALAML